MTKLWELLKEMVRILAIVESIVFWGCKIGVYNKKTALLTKYNNDTFCIELRIGYGQNKGAMLTY